LFFWGRARAEQRKCREGAEQSREERSRAEQRGTLFSAKSALKKQSRERAEKKPPKKNKRITASCCTGGRSGRRRLSGCLAVQCGGSGSGRRRLIALPVPPSSFIVCFWLRVPVSIRFLIFYVTRQAHNITVAYRSTLLLCWAVSVLLVVFLLVLLGLAVLV